MSLRSTRASTLVVFVCLGALSLSAVVLWTDADASVPDTTKAEAIWIWPGARDISRLESVHGRGRAFAIRTLGHPYSIDQNGDTEIWHYPWSVSCTVTFREARVISTYYTAGY